MTSNRLVKKYGGRILVVKGAQYPEQALTPTVLQNSQIQIAHYFYRYHHIDNHELTAIQEKQQRQPINHWPTYHLFDRIILDFAI
jgi:hypothetical protein